MSAPITAEERAACLDRAERELAAMRGWADEVRRRWAGLQAMASELGLRAQAESGAAE